MTSWIAQQANRILTDCLRGVRHIPWERAHKAATTYLYDYIGSPEHLQRIQEEAQALISAVFAQESDGGAQDA